MTSLQSCVEPGHLKVPDELVEHADWLRAIQQLRSINDYHTTTAKLNCIKHSCKITFTTLQKVTKNVNLSMEDFLPVVIFLVLKANPKYLYSNEKFIHDYENHINTAMIFKVILIYQSKGVFIFGIRKMIINKRMNKIGEC